MGQKISRRRFLENSSKGLVAAAFVPAFLNSDITKAFAATKGITMKLNDYYNHFGVNEKIIQDVIAEALSRGGDYCDLYFQHRIFNYIGLIFWCWYSCIEG